MANFLSTIVGGLSIAVPGELRAYRKAWEEFGGGVSWSDLFQPTIQLCTDGFELTSQQAAAIQQNQQLILDDPTLRFVECLMNALEIKKNNVSAYDREHFVKNIDTNELYGVGDTMKWPNLARTLKVIAEKGDDAFYTGDLADTIVKEIQDRGRLIWFLISIRIML